jgi:nitronate monooxygenase
LHRIALAEIDRDQMNALPALLHCGGPFQSAHNFIVNIREVKRMLDHPFPSLRLAGKKLLPIVQGGMGVGISAHRLAGSVAALGAVGTISSVDLRRHHPDLMMKSGRSRQKELINQCNLEALGREIANAREMAGGLGLVAVNVMRAVSEYAAYVRKACESGVEAIAVGAGLPLDLPELTTDFPRVALLPILSDARGVALLLKKWMRKGRLPDAVVLENPSFAAGHLGAARLEDVHAPHFAFSQVLAGSRQVMKELALESEHIPLIAAGGIHSHQQIKELMALGADAVQLGTPFAVSEEGDAHVLFKRTLAEAKPENIVTFMSAAGLPARAVRTQWLANYLEKEEKLQAKAKAKPCTQGFDCLLQCGWRDGNPKAGQFCIDTQLAYALNGDTRRGLFFRGSEPLPFGSAIRPVRELIDYLLNGRRPEDAPLACPALP